MLTQAIVKIQNEGAGFTEGSTEAGLVEVLTMMCREDAAIASAIVHSDKTIKDLGKKLYDYAKNHKVGSSYYMPPTVATKLIREFYGVEDQTPAPAAATAAPDNAINILDLL